MGAAVVAVAIPADTPIYWEIILLSIGMLDKASSEVYAGGLTDEEWLSRL